MRNALILSVLFTVACATTKPVETKATETKPESEWKFKATSTFRPMDVVVGPQGSFRCDCAQGSSGRMECYNCTRAEEKSAATPQQSSAGDEHNYYHLNDQTGKRYLCPPNIRGGVDFERCVRVPTN